MSFTGDGESRLSLMASLNKYKYLDDYSCNIEERLKYRAISKYKHIMRTIRPTSDEYDSADSNSGDSCSSSQDGFSLSNLKSEESSCASTATTNNGDNISKIKSELPSSTQSNGSSVLSSASGRAGAKGDRESNVESCKVSDEKLKSRRHGCLKHKICFRGNQMELYDCDYMVILRRHRRRYKQQKQLQQNVQNGNLPATPNGNKNLQNFLQTNNGFAICATGVDNKINRRTGHCHISAQLVSIPADQNFQINNNMQLANNNQQQQQNNSGTSKMIKLKNGPMMMTKIHQSNSKRQ